MTQMKHRMAPGALLILSVALSSGVTTAQRLSAETRDCGARACEIVLEKVASLSEGKDRGILMRAPVAVRARSGQWYLQASDLRRVVVFNPTGTVVKLLGGFTRGVFVLPGADDSVHIYDPVAKVLHRVNDSLDLGPSPLPLLFTPDLILKDGHMIVAQQIPTRGLAGFPLHLMGPDGRLVRSFGVDQPVYRPDLPRLMDRIVAPSPEGHLWTAAPGRYALQLWNRSTGALMKTLTVTSTWFVDSDASSSDPQTRPKPILEALWQTDALIWVLARDADAKWAPKSAVPPQGERAVPLAEVNAKYDWVLEALDPTSGRVLASLRFPRVLAGFAPQPFLTADAEASTGTNRVIDVWLPKLRLASQR